jgi:hypothetical protein
MDHREAFDAVRLVFHSDIATDAATEASAEDLENRKKG